MYIILYYIYVIYNNIYVKGISMGSNQTYEPYMNILAQAPREGKSVAQLLRCHIGGSAYQRCGYLNRNLEHLGQG